MAVLVTGEKLEILITEAEIASRINTLSEQISKAYEQTDQLVVIGLLRGSFVFIADLVRCLDLPVEVDFMTVSSYGNKMKSSGQLRIIKDVETDLKNRDVLIIEDIIDTGTHIITGCKSAQKQENPSLFEFALYSTNHLEEKLK